MTTGKLNEDDRQLVRDIVAGLHGPERQREAARIRSALLRLNPDIRLADNARKAAQRREQYHANIEESRRKGAEKERRRMRGSNRNPLKVELSAAGHESQRT